VKTDKADKTAVIPNQPRNLSQVGSTKYSIILFWEISDNVGPDQVAGHTFRVTAVEGGQVIQVPGTQVRPDDRGWYRHEINVNGGTQPVFYNVQVRAQALDGEHGPFCPVLVCSTSS
jgi:hypothetical protein